MASRCSSGVRAGVPRAKQCAHNASRHSVAASTLSSNSAKSSGTETEKFQSKWSGCSGGGFPAACLVSTTKLREIHNGATPKKKSSDRPKAMTTFAGNETVSSQTNIRCFATMQVARKRECWEKPFPHCWVCSRRKSTNFSRKPHGDFFLGLVLHYLRDSQTAFRRSSIFKLHVHAKINCPRLTSALRQIIAVEIWAQNITVWFASTDSARSTIQAQFHGQRQMRRPG